MARAATRSAGARAGLTALLVRWPRAATGSASARTALAASVVLTLLAAPAAAQTIRGAVRDVATGQPLDAAFVILLADGERAAAALTDAAGVFRIVAPGPGTYLVRVERIGYESVETEPFAAEAGVALDPLRVDLAARALSLEGIEVEGDRRCRVRPEDGRLTARLWDEVRKALTVAAWTEQESVLQYRLVNFERVLDPADLEILEERRRPSAGFHSASPFVSRPVEELQEDGYVQENADGSYTFYAPDAEALLSDPFLDGHCFSATTRGAPEPGWIGLAFQPVRRRSTPDVRGVLWVDRTTAELRTLELRWTWLPGGLEDDRIGGTIDFARIPEGPWIVRRWSLRIPAVAMQDHVPPLGGIPERRPVLVRISETGGEVTRVRAPDGSALLESRTATLSGLVYDSLSMAPLHRATVYLDGAADSARAGIDGRFVLAGLPAGRYRVLVTAPLLDTLAWAPPAVTVVLAAGGSTGIDLAVPTLATLTAELCGAPAVEGGESALAGRVRLGPAASAAGETLPEGVELVLGWETGSLAVGTAMTRGGRPVDAVRVGQGRWQARLALDPDGGFFLCGLPADETITLRAEAPGLVTSERTVRLEPGILGRVVLHLAPVPPSS